MSSLPNIFFLFGFQGKINEDLMEGLVTISKHTIKGIIIIDGKTNHNYDKDGWKID